MPCFCTFDRLPSTPSHPIPYPAARSHNTTGYTLFVEDESARANALLSRGDMESVMVVHLAGRSAEKLVMGEGEVRGASQSRLLAGFALRSCAAGGSGATTGEL